MKTTFVRRVLGILAVFSLLKSSVQAAPVPTTAPHIYPILEVPRATVTPQLTAQSGDPAWKRAAFIPNLTISKNSSPRDRTLPTQVKMLWDEKFLYIRFICHDDHIESPYVGRDKPHYKGDVTEVFLDVLGDGHQYFELEVSPNNQVFDLNTVLTADARCDENGMLIGDVLGRDYWSDPAWNMDGLLHRTARISEQGKVVGWICDMALPASVLRRTGKTQFEPMTLRANLLRYNWRSEGKSRRLEAMNWSPVLQGCPHISPGAMGFLKLLDKTSK